MKIKTLTSFLETVAPPSYQENYDNAGLIVGNPDAEITGALLCLDSTEAVVEEAIKKNCNLIIAHHPIVFKGLKRFNGNNYVERTVMAAIKNDVAIYAIHTNLDNVYHQGVNAKIAEKLGLQNTRILAPKANLKKLSVSIPTAAGEGLTAALREAGAHRASIIGGGKEEAQMQVIFPAAVKGDILQALRNNHPAEGFAYDITATEDRNSQIGSGMVGELAEALPVEEFLAFLKKTMRAGTVKYTRPLGRDIKKVAVCGGAGGFLLGRAIGAGADIFITSDYKYHEFFDADGRIIIADIGHYESEQFTIELLHEIISKKFVNFAARLTEERTNPVFYH